MKYLGIDYGEKRIGLAIAGELKIATPYPAVMNIGINSSIDKIIDIIKLENIEKIVIGLPRSLSGRKGDMCDKIERFSEKLKEKIDIDIFFEDERMSSKEAGIVLRNSKKKKKKRKDGTLDSMAASLILSSWLESEKYEV